MLLLHQVLTKAKALQIPLKVKRSDGLPASHHGHRVARSAWFSTAQRNKDYTITVFHEAAGQANSQLVAPILMGREDAARYRFFLLDTTAEVSWVANSDSNIDEVSRLVLESERFDCSKSETCSRPSSHSKPVQIQFGSSQLRGEPVAERLGLNEESMADQVSLFSVDHIDGRFR